MLRVLPALLLATALTGCTQARIAVPSDLMLNSEQLELTGMGMWPNGTFRLGSSQGRFTRRAVQTKVFDTFMRNVGSGGFEIAGPEFGGSAGGRCGFDERERDVGAGVIVPLGRLTYHCEFQRNGHRVSGGLFLAEVPNGSALLAGRTRAGELQIGDVKVGIRPIHHAASGGLPTGMPLGYAFEIAGLQVGAVDLNGTAKTIYAPRQPGPERDAVLMASLALSVFWDPGE
jgi:hypothetical protein